MLAAAMAIQMVSGRFPPRKNRKVLFPEARVFSAFFRLHHFLRAGHLIAWMLQHERLGEFGVSLEKSVPD
jgi:hypothetical protein